jgi:hypothetical protein
MLPPEGRMISRCFGVLFLAPLSTQAASVTAA